MKKVFSLLLAVMLVVSLAVPAAAAGNEGTVTINGKNNITFKPGSSYSATDLFDDGFKGIMPGDKIEETITIRSGFSFHEDSLKVYMRAIPHTNSDNKPVTGVDAVEMMDFLNKLNLRVTKGSEVIFKGQAGKLGGLKKNVLLGTFRRDGSIQLKVELEWPTGGNYDYNKYANRVGEIDWVFTVEAYDDPEYDNPKTGDYIMLAVATMAVSAAALIVLCTKKIRKKQ